MKMCIQVSCLQEKSGLVTLNHRERKKKVQHILRTFFLSFVFSEEPVTQQRFYCPSRDKLHSSPPTTPNNCGMGSRLTWLEPFWNCSRSWSFHSQSFSMSERSLDDSPMWFAYPLSRMDSDRVEDATGDVSRLSDRKIPVPELHSLFESAPRERPSKTRGGDGDRWRVHFYKQTRGKQGFQNNPRGSDKICSLQFELRCNSTIIFLNIDCTECIYATTDVNIPHSYFCFDDTFTLSLT